MRCPRTHAQERAKLAVLEAALSTSEYTDTVDIMDFRSIKLNRITSALDDLLNIIGGLMVAADAREGRKLLARTKDDEDVAGFYQSVFEVGRRFKIMSPDKMRTTYGKLVHCLMDAATREVQHAIGFSCIEPIQTVHGALREGGIEDLLDDERLGVATQQVLRGDAAKQAQAKADAIRALASEYAERSRRAGQRASEADVERILLSLGDANAFLAYNQAPVARALELLYDTFSPKGAAAPELSLAIQNGRGGARLTHSHSTQFAYVEQSLRLWNEIMGNFYMCARGTGRGGLRAKARSLHESTPALLSTSLQPCSTRPHQRTPLRRPFHTAPARRLWTLAEEDLLNGVSYRLRDTGQGLQRVKDAPKVSAAMHSILNRVQASVGGHWVGSSVVHMGDTDVPNALVFIDKYTQVGRGGLCAGLHARNACG